MAPKSKRHVCGHCQESFTSKVKLQTHMRTHDDAEKCDLDMSISSELESSSSPIKEAMLEHINNVQMVEAMRSNLMTSLPAPLTGLPSPIATVQSNLLPNAIGLPSPMNLPRLPSPIHFTKSLLFNKNSNVSQSNEVKNENEKFREYKCNKCDKSFTTAGSHKRHQSGCKATAKIVPVEDEIDSEEMDDDDIDSVPSSSDDEMNFASSSFEGNSRSKMTGNISRRVNSLLKEKKAKMVTCKVCKSKYNKDFGDCQKCKIKEFKKKTEPKKTPQRKNTSKSATPLTLPPPIASTLPPPMQLQTEEVCVSCGEICPNKQSLANHQITCEAYLKDKEDKEKENFNDEDEFSTPEKNDGEGIEECATCGEKFHNKVALLEHLASHTGPLDKGLMCGICQKTFSRKYHLDRHLLMTACSGQPPPSHTCQVCGKAYTRKDNLREHLRAHAGEVLRRKKYKCDFCDKHFHGTSLLKIHERTHTGERPFKCDFCSKAFPSTGALTKHRRIHTGEKPYACVDCGVSFSLKGTLNRHMRIHTGVRPHKCEYCGKEFIQAGGLKAHLFFHTGQNGFKCTDCGKLFNRKARLQMHIRYVHEKLKPYECSDCGKAFTRREDLYRHSVLHSGEKPHQCPTCQKRFAIKPSLKLHMLTHTKEEPRSCHECGRAFIRKDCLLRHMRKRHRELLNKILLDEKEAFAPNPDSPGSSRVLTEQNICDSIRELLSLLVDESTLKGFGWPDKPVDELLESVIKRCGHTPVNPEDYSYMDRLRENSKLLFTVVIDDNAVKTLLNNQTVDEVILHVLRLAKS